MSTIEVIHCNTEVAMETAIESFCRVSNKSKKSCELARAFRDSVMDTRDVLKVSKLHSPTARAINITYAHKSGNLIAFIRFPLQIYY